MLGALGVAGIIFAFSVGYGVSRQHDRASPVQLNVGLLLHISLKY